MYIERYEKFLGFRGCAFIIFKLICLEIGCILGEKFQKYKKERIMWTQKMAKSFEKLEIWAFYFLTPVLWDTPKIFTLEITMFDLKMTVKSGLEKTILKCLCPFRDTC